MGLFGAARAAYRTPHYLDDIRNIRSLVFGSHAIWPVVVICAVSGLYTTVRLGSPNSANDPVLAILFQFVFGPVPFLPPMLAGFLAPRSTWLAGLLSAFISTMTLVIVLGITAGKLSDTSGTISIATPTPNTSSGPTATQLATPTATVLVTSTPTSSGTPATSATPTAGASPMSSSTPAPSASAAANTSGSSSGNLTGDLINLAFVLLAQSLAFGAVMGALSGWYKRFLALTSGPRKPPAKSGGSRSPQRRKPATR